MYVRNVCTDIKRSSK